MTNKSHIALLLVATLVLALASAGVCFADVITAYPSAGGVFSTVVSRKTFFKINYLELDGTTQSSPLLLFNGLSAFETSSSEYCFLYGGVTSNSYSKGRDTLFFSGSNLSTATLNLSNSSPAFGSSGGSSSQLTFSGVTIHPTDMSISFGDSVDWSSGVVGEYFTFSIPSGYALVIDGACDILERDYYINNSWNFVGEGTGNRTNGSSERIISRSQIVDGFSPDKNLSRSQLIQWVALNPNLFGTASNYEFSGRDLVTVSSGAAFVISYPLYDGVIPLNGTVRQFENSVNFVGSLYLNYSSRPTIRYVALKSNTQLDNNSVGFYNTFVPTTYDEPASEVVGTDSTVISAPSDAPTGGGNAGEPPLDDEQSIFGFLGRFINRVTNLFNQASEAIHSISGACQSFFSALLEMFSWLPPEWTAVLWGFFLILACVGVVKLFL